MDVNGTKLHLLIGQRDWRAVIAQTAIDPVHADWTAVPNDKRAVVWDADFGGIALLRQVPVMFGGTGETSGFASRGTTADGFGNIFWLDDTGSAIKVQPAGLQASGKFWGTDDLDPQGESLRGAFGPLAPATPPVRPTLRGLAVTTHHYLLVGTLAPSGLLIFDLDAGSAPCGWRWPAPLDFHPWLLAPTADGGVVILDFNEATGRGRLWRLDRHFSPCNLGPPTMLAPSRGADFSPLDGPNRTTAARVFAGSAAIGAGTPIDVVAPVGLAALADGSILLLAANSAARPARLLRFVNGGVVTTVALDATLTSPQLALDLTNACSFAVAVDQTTSDATSGRLYVATTQFAQAFEFAFTARSDSLVVQLNARALPLPNTERPDLVATNQDVFFASGDVWFALAEQPRYRYLPSATLSGGQSPQASAMVFDGKDPGCVWHRVMLDACIPAGCEVRFRSRAADEIDQLAESAWTDETAPYLRSDGSELPFDRPFGRAQQPHLGTFETLLMNAEGRYLQLDVTLVSDGRASPRIRALRIYYPRFSYLNRYLPAVYREDPQAADFLDRWLANPEGLLTGIEGRIADAQIVLDPATAPPEYLDWLGGWFDALLDPTWDDSRRRLFLKFAWLLFRWRGSSRGLLAFLRLATDECPDESIFDALLDGPGCECGRLGGFIPRIVENFELRQVPAALLGDPTTPAPALTATRGKWQAADGGARLHVVFQEWLLCRYGSVPRQNEPPDWATFLARFNAAWAQSQPLTDLSSIRFSAVPPSNTAELADWEAFTASIFNTSYTEVTPQDIGYWQEFLARRYVTIDALNQAYGLTGSAKVTAFAAASLPMEHSLPADGAALNDWLQFALLALPIRRNAHRFTVLVPARLGEDPGVRADRLLRVAAIVETEKPAHTSFDAKLFWALFQVGSARVGIDSVVGESNRFLPMVLDAGYLRDAYLAAGFPWNATDRRVIGRDRLKGNETWTSTTAVHARVQ